MASPKKDGQIEPPCTGLEALLFLVGEGSLTLGCAFYSFPLLQALSGPVDSVALRTNDLTISCHRDHCDVTIRGQVVQGEESGMGMHSYN